MMLVAGAGDLISIFLGIEILSVALYVLCALEVWRERVPGERPQVPDHRGPWAPSVLLYGLALLFGATARPALSEIGETLAGRPSATSRSSSRRWR